MPLYEYRCNSCAQVFDVLRPMAERELAAVCPNCESRASMPLISTIAVRPASAGAGEAPAVSAGGCCGGACSCGRT